jgi:hypothetical protein
MALYTSSSRRHPVRRVAPLLALAIALLSPPTVAAQADVPRVYAMNLKIAEADIPAWVDYFQRYDVPILSGMVADRELLAFDLWTHHTGGEHSVRMMYVVPNFGAVAEMGSKYGPRMTPAGAAAFMALQSTMREMVDDVWYIGDSNLPDGRPESPFVYESSFQIAPGDLGQWKENFARYTRPGLERAMEAGLITAWVRLDHSIGGPWNSKTLVWMKSWDSMDEALAMLGQTVQERGAPADWRRMLRGHSDAIWRVVPKAR